ncbi:unnamed protein product [Effrenium voratum]|nr:unnamed protein product [Effrenium voratum]
MLGGKWKCTQRRWLKLQHRFYWRLVRRAKHAKRPAQQPWRRRRVDPISAKPEVEFPEIWLPPAYQDPFTRSKRIRLVLALLGQPQDELPWSEWEKETRCQGDPDLGCPPELLARQPPVHRALECCDPGGFCACGLRRVVCQRGRLPLVPAHGGAQGFIESALSEAAQQRLLLELSEWLYNAAVCLWQRGRTEELRASFLGKLKRSTSSRLSMETDLSHLAWFMETDFSEVFPPEEREDVIMRTLQIVCADTADWRRRESRQLSQHDHEDKTGTRVVQQDQPVGVQPQLPNVPKLKEEQLPECHYYLAPGAVGLWRVVKDRLKEPIHIHLDEKYGRPGRLALGIMARYLQNPNEEKEQRWQLFWNRVHKSEENLQVGTSSYTASGSDQKDPAWEVDRVDPVDAVDPVEPSFTQSNKILVRRAREAPTWDLQTRCECVSQLFMAWQQAEGQHQVAAELNVMMADLYRLPLGPEVPGRGPLGLLVELLPSRKVREEAGRPVVRKSREAASPLAPRAEIESLTILVAQYPGDSPGYYRTFIDEILESTPLEGTIGRARSLPATVRSRDEQLEEDEEVEMQNIVVTLEERAKNLQLGDGCFQRSFRLAAYKFFRLTTLLCLALMWGRCRLPRAHRLKFAMMALALTTTLGDSQVPLLTKILDKADVVLLAMKGNELPTEVIKAMTLSSFSKSVASDPSEEPEAAVVIQTFAGALSDFHLLAMLIPHFQKQLSNGPNNRAEAGNSRAKDAEKLRRVLEDGKEQMMQLAEEHRFAWTDLIAELQAKLLAVEQPEELDFSKITATAQPFLPEAEDPSPIFPELELTPRDAKLKVTLTGFDRTISVSDSGDENPTPDLQKAVQVAKHHAVSENVEVLHDTSPTHSSKLGSRKSSNFLANYLGEMSANRPLMKRVKFYLDYAAGMLVLLNTVTMLLEFQLEGHLTGQQIGTVDAGEADYGDVLAVLRASDGVFVFIFLVEWLLRLFIDRAAFVTDFADWFDTLCVWSGVVDFILRVGLAQQHTASRSVVILRLMRALKSLRAIRMVRSLRFFRGLRVLVQACQCFLPSLCWSMVLLGVFMTMGALMMGNLLQAFITDEALLLDDRKWLWERYGTAFRATYTLFEITFAGNWPTNARPVMDKASHVFVLFYLQPGSDGLGGLFCLSRQATSLCNSRSGCPGQA